MHIMTKDGWKTLSQREFTHNTDPVAYNGIPAPYTGSFPSAAICDFHNRMQEQMKFFDTGARMVYGKPDRHVEVDNMAAAHPIKYPPKGF